MDTLAEVYACRINFDTEFSIVYGVRFDSCAGGMLPDTCVYRRMLTIHRRDYASLFRTLFQGSDDSAEPETIDAAIKNIKSVKFVEKRDHVKDHRTMN
jgi:uncharacterized cysteine cluster protein YcgN (CxxCxxCC family)